MENKVTKEALAAKVKASIFIQPATTSTTICLLRMENGAIVTGESHCAHPDNFDKDIGEQVAKRNAVDKAWELEGYLLRERIYEAAQESSDG